MSTFGPMIPASQPEQWVLALAKRWRLEYIAEMERQAGKAPRFWGDLNSYVTAIDFTRWPDDMLPSMVVMNPGLAKNFIRHGDGSYDACWLMAAAFVFSGTDRQSTREGATAWGRAGATMFAQFRGVEHEGVQGLNILDEQYRDIPDEASRTLGAATIAFELEVVNVMSERGRPPESEPREDPYVDSGDLPIIESGKVTLNVSKEIETP